MESSTWWILGGRREAVWFVSSLNLKSPQRNNQGHSLSFTSFSVEDIPPFCHKINSPLIWFNPNNFSFRYIELWLIVNSSTAIIADKESHQAEEVREGGEEKQWKWRVSLWNLTPTPPLLQRTIFFSSPLLYREFIATPWETRTFPPHNHRVVIYIAPSSLSSSGWLGVTPLVSSATTNHDPISGEIAVNPNNSLVSLFRSFWLIRYARTIQRE